MAIELRITLRCDHYKMSHVGDDDNCEVSTETTGWLSVSESFDIGVVRSVEVSPNLPPGWTSSRNKYYCPKHRESWKI